jgi:hypothetical protein
VPKDFRRNRVNVRASFDTGPLAGRLEALTSFNVLPER